jgi:L-lactate dehydrogenase complex protein LldG
MSASRDRILASIRTALGRSGPLPQREAAVERERLNRHPAGPHPTLDWEPAGRFRERARLLACTVDDVAAWPDVPQAVATYLQAQGLPAAAVAWPDLPRVDWQAAGLAVEMRRVGGTDLVGITGCFCAIAETGTLLCLSGAGSPPSTSLLPETHVALVPGDRIVRTMEDAWALLRSERPHMPRAANFISGPSRTADIEQTLVLGAHGPYRTHVVLIGA